MTIGFAKLDGKGRIAVGRYTELEPGQYFRIEEDGLGGFTATPAVQIPDAEVQK